MLNKTDSKSHPKSGSDADDKIIAYFLDCVFEFSVWEDLEDNCPMFKVFLVTSNLLWVTSNELRFYEN